jgi:hypothetical protein
MRSVVARKEFAMNRWIFTCQYARILLSTSSAVLFGYYPM